MSATVRRERWPRPETVAETADLMRTSAGVVLVRGAGTKLDWAGTVADADIVLDTTHLSGVLTHNPADMTASVRAGTTLSTLQQHLGERGQWLALDPPSAGRGATLGGLLAAGDSGPSRLRYGALRDLVIGVTLVLADGTVARSGGHVIKNVAGYDLAKLVYGSLGSLAVVAEVVLRLHPRPVTSSTVAGPADAPQATVAALALAASALEPAAVEWVSDGDGGRLLVRIDGSEAVVEDSAGRLSHFLATLGVPAATLSAAEADTTWRSHAVAVLGASGVAPQTVARVSGLPGDLARLAADATRAGARAGLDVALVSSAALGLHTVRLSGGRADAHAQAFTEIRTAALAQEASVLLRARPEGFDDLVDVLGPAPTSVALLRRIKAQFDPTGRLAPGRFRPWF